ncbi:hypothetical protein GOQ27_13965 [Clostridium sp. D2Q-11]|uniref:Uncharacterized protein n=1 Tax=Anaeromonas frigoriresistens TaxID=2683708 RepID=A0A942UYY5_9FIRM|nr:hypothetical protein [Anaeromonas frigoriresistens]MBS4539576.1 hypothetical protein [Anaeromonas frigoriresistens]
MKAQKIAGLLIIALSILTFSIQTSLSQLTMYIDQTTPEYWTDISNYIPNTIYISTIIAIGIGLYLIFKKEK